MNVDPDLLFILGIVFAFLTFPALVSAFSESRPPRGAALMIVLAAGLILTAMTLKPGGYSIQETPKLFVEVVSGLFN